MRRFQEASLFILVIFFFLPLALSAQARTQKGFAVVELFTSEGCSSCPPADDALLQLVRKADKQKLPIYALEWHVDYWDYLGWKDPWDSKFATARQYAYARILPSSVYTPQVVINGQYVPNYAGDLRELEAQAYSLVNELTNSVVSFLAVHQDSPTSIRVSLEVMGAPHDSRVLLTEVEGDLKATPNAGENAGRRLVHSNVVRAARFIPAVSGEVTLDAPPAAPGTTRRLMAILESSSSLHAFAASQIGIVSASDNVLSARIIDLAGNPVPGALVQICSVSLCIPAKTDDQGAFTLPVIPNGSYTIGITLPASFDQRQGSTAAVSPVTSVTLANIQFIHCPKGVLIAKTVWR